MKIESAIEYMNAAAPQLSPALMHCEIASFAIDSREAGAGGLFFALSQPDYARNGFNGDFADATVFAAAALETGAAAVVLRRDRFDEHEERLRQFADRLIFVDDVIAALQRLAARLYREWNRPVVAITGSAGKTTAKELTAHVIGHSGRKVLRNVKNYNNGIGHPLTVLDLARDPSPDLAVLEMGMSTPMNEIQRLCRITPPDVAVVLNVLPVHIEHLGTIENIAIAKAEIVEGMKSGGTAVLNRDDPRVYEMRRLSRGTSLTFGVEENADVTARQIDFSEFGKTRFTLSTPTGKAPVRFALNGRHNVYNALAAAAAASAVGMAADEIAAALETATPPPQRGEVIEFVDGFTIINDSYNSNPQALISMAETLLESGRSAKRRIIVAGEMLELGPQTAEIHRDTGARLAELGIDSLIGVRGQATELVKGAAEAGLDDARFAEETAEAAEILLSTISRGDLILIKGSRGVRTERILARVLEKFERTPSA